MRFRRVKFTVFMIEAFGSEVFRHKYLAMKPEISVAPMMDRTDRHFRFIARQYSPSALLYTEMVALPALFFGKNPRLLSFDPIEKPLALQFGGYDPKQLEKCCQVSNGLGFCEINLNVGCPSDRVREGRFGACLMGEPEHVALLVKIIKENSSAQVSVKTRTGIDHQDSYDFLYDFISKVSVAGCSKFIIHARKAWLNGLTPKENRTVPPLEYDKVIRLKKDFPQLEIILNGGIDSVEKIDGLEEHFNGFMIGRKAYEDPYFLSILEKKFITPSFNPPEEKQLLETISQYAKDWLSHTEARSLRPIYGHCLNLFRNKPNSSKFRRVLNQYLIEASTKLSVDILQRSYDQAFLQLS